MSTSRSAAAPAPIVFIAPQASLADPTATGAVRRGGPASAALPGGLHQGQVRHALRFGPAIRGGPAATPGAAPARAEALPGRDVVVLTIDNGPTLWLHPEVARQVLQGPDAGAAAPARPAPGSSNGASIGAHARAGDAPPVVVARELPWPTQDLRGAPPAARGIAGRVLLAGLDVVTGAAAAELADALANKAADQAALLAARKVDSQVRDGVGGVYPLGRSALTRLKDSGAQPLAQLPAAGAAPVLIFIHGTFSNTAQAFGKLWSQHAGVVAELFERYSGIYGFDHATLGVSPVRNALELARTLPDNAVLHLATHSRGGLVAEVLARAAANGAASTADDFTPGDRKELAELAALLKKRRVQVQRVVRVACPADGTVLAGKRLDAYLSVFKWALELGGVPLVPEVLDFIATVAQRRADASMLPGLAAQAPGSPLVRWLRSPPAAPVAGDLRVIAGDVAGDSLGNWIKVLLTDSFFLEDHDYVVDTDAMFGGAPRALAPLVMLDRGGHVSHGRYFSNAKTAQALLAALTQDRPAGFGPVPPAARRGAARGSNAEDGAAESADWRPDDTLPPLAIEVVNANLMFTRQPLLVGHYRSTQLEGSERAVNSLIGDGMAQALRAGIYPDGPGAFQMFHNMRTGDNPLQLPRPEWAIVVGLGDESDLKPDRLVHTLRQAIIGWAQRLHEQGPQAPRAFQLASVLVASGGTRVSPGASAQLIAQAALEANQRLRQCAWPLMSKLLLVELYLDRATEAWRALNVLAAAQPGRWVVHEHIDIGAGALRRPLDTNYRGAEYDLISATSEGDDANDPAIAFTLDTRRARSEVRAQATQPKLVRELVKRASNDRHQDPQIGRTLFQLLVPVELESFFGGETEMRIELDGGTAAIPWELLLDQASEDAAKPPWAVRTKLIRKLRTVRFRQTVSDAGTGAGALVIGEPAVTQADRYPRLPGARHEARAVAEQLAASFDGGRLQTLIADDDAASAPDAQRVINALLERDWRIVHIAGHGEPPEMKDADTPQPKLLNPRGVVLSDGCYLGYREIRTMRTVPELVFINCCHLAERPAEQALQREALHGGDYERPHFAATVAEELIKLGVRCVIAAGWAVEDEPAQTFATEFYGAIVRGRRFIDAVADARDAAWRRRGHGNTWAAYQCYGDPEWRLADHSESRRPAPPEVRFAGISSPLGLTIALETVAVETQYLSAKDRPQRAPVQRERVSYLQKRFESVWGGMGAVAEAFGVAWREVDDIPAALKWLERAIHAEDGSASQRAGEQAANLRARQAEMRFEAVHDKTHAALALRASRKAPAASTADVHRDAAVQRAADEARSELTKAQTLIEQLIGLHATVERLCIAGSACKRLAMVELRMHNDQAALAAAAQMKKHYGQAETLAQQKNLARLYYPALNRMAAELVVDAADPRWPGFAREHVARVRQSLEAATLDDPDFWSVAGLTELTIYDAVARQTLAAQWPAIRDAYADLHMRIGSPRDWQSVATTARFVIDRYQARAVKTEQQACGELLAVLEGYAQER